MVKTAFVTALLTASAFAWGPDFLKGEFLQGAETGIFLGDESQFKDYNCALPAVDPQAQMWIGMITPMKVMMENMNQGKHIVALDTLESMTKQIALLYSLFMGEYDGGDFCKGLIIAKEFSTIMLTFGKNVFAGLFGGFGETHEETHDAVEKMLSNN